MMKLNFLFIVMDVIALFVYPIIFIHSKLRKKTLSSEFTNIVTIKAIK